MYTQEQNETLTRVGSGTPMGELLRRYWWPIGVSEHLREKPTFIRLLGEDLVLYRSQDGEPAVIAARCAHRGANLCLGKVSKKGIRCRYHGWLYDRSGKLLETPGEKGDLTQRVRQKVYAAQEFGGLIFAYLGPEPRPLLPRYDFLAADEPREAKIVGFAECNWLQCVENGMDPVHVSFLHSDVWTDLETVPDQIDYDETEWGIVYRSYRPGPSPTAVYFREHHCIMPGISIQQRGGRWSVPIDDTRTLQVVSRFFPPPENLAKYGKFKLEKSFANRSAAHTQSLGYDALKIAPFKEYKARANQFEDAPVLGYDFPGHDIAMSDATMLESLGPIVPREQENLGEVIDKGVILLRNLYLREIEAVKAGRDPKGTVRDPRQNELIILPTHERTEERPPKSPVTA